MKNVNLDSNNIYASLDMRFLYLNVPVDEALDQVALDEDLADQLINFADHCFKTHILYILRKLHRLTKGAAMGSDLLPVISYIFDTKTMVKI